MAGRDKKGLKHSDGMIKCESESLRLRLRPNDELAKFKLQALHTYKENRPRKGHDRATECRKHKSYGHVM
jgi:hypothetical protein